MYAGNDATALIGAVPLEGWWSIVGERLELDTDALGRLRRVRDDVMWRPDVDLLAFIAELRTQVRIAFVSNAWSDLRAFLERREILRPEDELVCSAEVGCAKPGSRIYEIACERLGLVPASCVFVDDVAENVDAARALGMAGVLHTDAAATRKALRALL